MLRTHGTRSPQELFLCICWCFLTVCCSGIRIFYYQAVVLVLDTYHGGKQLDSALWFLERNPEPENRREGFKTRRLSLCNTVLVYIKPWTSAGAARPPPTSPPTPPLPAEPNHISMFPHLRHLERIPSSRHFTASLSAPLLIYAACPHRPENTTWAIYFSDYYYDTITE